jgi:hypothetical protein
VEEGRIVTGYMDKLTIEFLLFIHQKVKIQNTHIYTFWIRKRLLETRMAIDRNARCDRLLMDILGSKMNEIKPFAKSYKMMHEVEKEEQKAKKEGRTIQLICMFI